MIVGYEMGHRLNEERRAEIRLARIEQFQQWFLASAPGKVHVIFNHFNHP